MFIFEFAWQPMDELFYEHNGICLNLFLGAQSLRCVTVLHYAHIITMRLEHGEISSTFGSGGFDD